MTMDVILVVAAVAVAGVALSGALLRFAKPALVAAAAVLGMAVVFPAGGAGGVVGTVGAWLRDATGGWTEDACRASPEPCLKARAASLEKAQTAIETAVDAVRGQTERVAAIISERQVVVGQNDLLLKEGRNLVQQATDPAKPIPFVGRTYPKDALVTQLTLLFRERESLTAVLGQARSQHENLRKRLDELLISRGEVKSALALIPAQIEIVRANGVLADVSGAISSIDGTLLSSERQVQSLTSLMGSTEDLMRSAKVNQAAPVADSPAFTRFLETGNL
ncbi:hypothetical protein HL658_35585 [Azospirillum sp. RWY-5-1]|uniref:Uncharacterized protein n=1 Tax=Azospirillum oleiclasticum TaxID=2735135 RepID=A0ABX2TN01_9PROT|nr:hypothetical protein [Azospirillum oleiclasticum]NYZ17894.1 hypothetical protein [Azospirillum oleiclasticum]NYZ25102.1 hypothetical protein [Azospirillum oleiclasticum]